MSDYKWVSITSPADYDQLAPLLDPEYQPQEVVRKLKNGIRASVAGILIEHGYIDKDYRSTFYRFYAKKGRFYRDDCARLHFFDAQVSFDSATTSLNCADERLDDHYFGFVVLRPTLVATIGRSILSPDIRTGAKGHAIQAQHRVHLLGRRLSTWGFPWMSQHSDISVCAHVACWAILRHYSERFPQHREWLLHDITMMAGPFDPGGITPALGLSVFEAERIFQAAGTYPVIVGKVPGEEDRFYAQMLAYLESGFPLFAAMKKQAHAIVLAGYAWANPMNSPPFKSSHAWSQVDSLLAVDDNLLPYGCVPVASPTVAAGAPAPQPSYSAAEIDAFIVPLPDKIFYPASAVERQSIEFYQLLHRVGVALPPQDRLLRRYFATTISALRQFAWNRRSELGDKLVNMLMRLRTAQFVWVVEYASDQQWAQGHVGARAIIDATASPHDPMPVWFSHDGDNAILFDRTSAAGKPTIASLGRPSGAPIGRMEQNLRPVR